MANYVSWFTQCGLDLQRTFNPWLFSPSHKGIQPTTNSCYIFSLFLQEILTITISLKKDLLFSSYSHLCKFTINYIISYIFVYIHTTIFLVQTEVIVHAWNFPPKETLSSHTYNSTRVSLQSQNRVFPSLVYDRPSSCWLGSWDQLLQG